MHKPSPSRMTLINSLAASLGITSKNISTAAIFKKKRGDAPAGKRWISGVYIPGGERCNTTGTYPRNPKQAAQMQAMHDAWYAKKFGGGHAEVHAESN